jgi:small-conductance mechanosensitive channel
MAISPIHPGANKYRIFAKSRLAVFLLLLGLLLLCVASYWMTRDAAAHLSFPHAQGSAQGTLVDISPWQTAQALAPLAESAEEMRLARDAERLADHDVDQAFAAALRLANLRQQHRVLTGDALALSQKIAQLKQFIQNDQAQVDRLTPKAEPPATTEKNAAPQPAESDDLQVAKAQLGLDTDELTDAQRDFERASGDRSVQIQAELAAHEASMRVYDSQSQQEGETASVAAKKNATLALQLKAWLSQRQRDRMIQQARQQTLSSIAALTAEHNALEAQANAGTGTAPEAAPDRAAKLGIIKDQSAERQVLSIDDDRIQTEQQLATVYGQWSTQLALQHRAVLHAMLLSIALIVLIVICMMLSDAAVRHFMAQPAVERGQLHTLRNILEFSIQVVGVLLILLVVFGPPRQISTLLGLVTAGLTIALQDFIMAFLGWFVLMGRNGIRVGDWVEINGVGGEVTYIGLIYTTLLETGKLADKGIPTGRRIRLINSYAIRGQYFNFSTAGQWMWDEITVSIPASDDAYAMVESIHKAVLEETGQNAQAAEREWKSGTPEGSLSRSSTAPSVNLRPSASGIDIQVRYVTRASTRFEVRNRLYQHVIDLMHDQNQPGPAQPAHEEVKA